MSTSLSSSSTQHAIPSSISIHSHPNPNSDQKPSMYLQDKEEVKKVFNHFDANGDGKISTTELVLVMKALQSNTSEDEVRQMMEELDADLDGFISLEEFASFCKGRDDTAGATGDNGGLAGLKDAFELYDQDKNRVISSLRLMRERTREKSSEREK
ncbi:calcium-binding allergen Ole e 8-like [Camellia sinensis]|uniref:calcium-binding allergen Ole e 8-like n=1 Tax=Camellia sinensis TaxID=4442 RepID=UPI0010357C1B|nr:calcium-binding allergen Ole e 8-like [Camellia sinensis]